MQAGRQALRFKKIGAIKPSRQTQFFIAQTSVTCHKSMQHQAKVGLASCFFNNSYSNRDLGVKPNYCTTQTIMDASHKEPEILDLQSEIFRSKNTEVVKAEMELICQFIIHGISDYS